MLQLLLVHRSAHTMAGVRPMTYQEGHKKTPTCAICLLGCPLKTTQSWALQCTTGKMRCRNHARDESRVTSFRKRVTAEREPKATRGKTPPGFGHLGKIKPSQNNCGEKRVGYKICSQMNIAINVTQPGHWDHSNFFFAAGIHGCPCSEQSGGNICILESISFSVGIKVGKIVMWVEANPPETWLNDEEFAAAAYLN